MIKIEAYIREEKFEDVKEALSQIEVHGITVYQVMGCGIQKGYTEIVRGNDSRKEFFNRIIDVVTLLGGDMNDAL